MKLVLALLLSVALLGFSACSTDQPGLGGSVQGTGSVEDLERQSPVTDAPDVREGQMARAAADYAGDRRHGSYHGYHRGHSHSHGHGGHSH